jgi:predicted enzyme related to lactoylglutathione lyase
MPNPVVHFEVLGKDAQALADFYRDTFNWQLEPVMPT